jgi:hypothetical protein
VGTATERTRVGCRGVLSELILQRKPSFVAGRGAYAIRALSDLCVGDNIGLSREFPISLVSSFH